MSLNHWFRISVGLVLLNALSSGCGDDADPVVADAGHETVVPEAVHWSYSGETGPSHWSELAAANSACSAGVEQTPIDIPSTVTPGLVHSLEFHYQPSDLTILNNGHTVQANYETGSRIMLEDTEYELVQFHFHAHSEHTVAGKSYPLEMHLVHKSAAGALAVVGVFIEQGAENEALSEVFANLPKKETEAKAVGDVQIDVSNVLPKERWAWRYSGSLTTPPCTEGVQWTVLSQPIRASASQIKAFTDIFSAEDRTIEGAHFDYEGESGPTHWGGLAPGWSLCESGIQQSPIDIPASAQPAVASDLTVNYEPGALTILNNGHTVQVNYPDGSGIVLGGSKYSLLQFHFHAHSEHSIAGHRAPLELHLVHRNADNALAVIGVMIEEGPENAALEGVFSHMPAKSGPAETHADTMIDASAFLPGQLSMWRYEGSLTTPPCSESVKWHVLAGPITASAAQIAKFTRLYSADARPSQPLGARTLH
jgi:carbonic anhydrase